MKRPEPQCPAPISPGQPSRGCSYPLAYHALQHLCPEIEEGALGMGHCTPLRCCILMGVALFRRLIGPGHPQRIPQPDQARTVLTQPVRPASPALDQGTCPSWILSSLPSPARRHGFCAPPRPSLGRPPSWPGAPRAHRLLSPCARSCSRLLRSCPACRCAPCHPRP